MQAVVKCKDDVRQRRHGLPLGLVNLLQALTETAGAHLLNVNL